MAELAVTVVGALLGVVIERILKSQTFIKLFQGKKGIKFDAEILDRLNITLYNISDVLEDAQVKEGAEAVRTWLGKVRAEVNHADDLLDEFNTECLRLQLLGDDLLDQLLHKQTDSDLKVHRCCFPFRKPKNNPGYADATLFFEELMPNLEKVTTRLEKFEKQIERLGLQKLDRKKKFPHREPSSSVVDKSQFVGRDGENEKMIERVLSDGGAPDVSVIAITGMGGIGKTTLAQHVYNDERVKEKFQTRAWVCVSEEYDAFKITKALLMEVNSAVVDKKDDFNRLQVKLKENLAGKSFLIILDDIWNDNSNDWSSLKTPLSYGSRGSKIIVTTRNEEVALTMQTERFHQLKPMSEDQSWSLFNKQAFDNGDHTPLHEFERIGKEIVKKCKGLPLAIKMIAGALRPQRDINVWQDFLTSEDWAVGGDILPPLSLSYKHLPSYLKGCFAFCALFHKDVPFDKDEAVLLWMANDLVRPSTQKVGRHYFEELKSRSFFEFVDGKKYLMHDLINDLARSVTGNTCIRLEDYQAADRDQSLKRENGLPVELLHFSYLRIHDEKFEWLSRVAQARSLRTFLPIHQCRYRFNNLTTNFFSDTLPRFQRLRALNLSQYHISMVPDSIGDLKHLRFLNLASTNLKNLPNAIGKCMNLQTLILKNCRELVELPKDMRLLINLQHVDVRGVGDPFIKKMATWLRMFKDIPNISVVVDKIQGSDLELLVQLCDSLKITGLGDTDVTTIGRAKNAGLIGKDYIENLSLEWGDVAKFSEDELNKLAKLQPHTNTKKLSIHGYTGSIFPYWLGDYVFTNMESLSLTKCKNCVVLPPLGQLTGLKKLEIFGMDGIREIGKEFYGNASTSKPFQALEKLKFSDMAEWVIWNTHSVVFPSLKSLEIHNCNNMLSFLEGGLAAPNLKRLVVEYCSKMKSLPARMHTQLPLLTYLSIGNCHEIECFTEGGLPSSLETLHIEHCSKMRICQTNWGLQKLPNLKTVVLGGFEDTLFPEEGLFPTTLETLRITRFSNLESLDENGLQDLCSLQLLWISDCLNLKDLPQQIFSSSLSSMSIYNCERLKSFPYGLAAFLSFLHICGCPMLAACIEREKGKDWPKVSHITMIYISWPIISNPRDIARR